MTSRERTRAQSDSPGLSRASITRRTALGALALGGIGFAAFGPRGDKASHGKRIVLDYWEKWTQHEAAAMQRVVDAFNDSQDRIHVRMIVTNLIDRKAMIAIAGGSPPDLVGLYAYNLPPFAEAGALVPLDELGPRSGVRLSNYKAGLQQIMTYPVAGRSERFWGIVNTAGTVALYYRPDLLRSVGINAPPRTIAELDECHARLLKTSATGEIQRVGFLHSEPGWWNWLWPASFGGRIYDATAAKTHIDSPECVKAYEWLQSYPRAMGVSRVTSFFEQFRTAIFSPRNSFLTGQVAMAVQGPWMGNIINQFGPGTEYGVCPMPTVSGVNDAEPVGLIDTDVIVIPRGAKNPEASMEFIAFSQRPEMVKLLARAHYKINPLAEKDEEFDRTHPNKGIAVHSAIAASPSAFVAPPTRAWQEMRDAIDQSVQRMWRLEIDAAKELAALQPRAQQFVDRAIDERRRRHGAAMNTSRTLSRPGGIA